MLPSSESIPSAHAFFLTDAKKIVMRTIPMPLIERHYTAPSALNSFNFSLRKSLRCSPRHVLHQHHLPHDEQSAVVTLVNH